MQYLIKVFESSVFHILIFPSLSFDWCMLACAQLFLHCQSFTIMHNYNTSYSVFSDLEKISRLFSQCQVGLSCLLS